MRTGGDEAGVDEFDTIELTGEIGIDHVLADRLGIGVGGVVAEPAEAVGDLVATEAEVALSLAADGDHRIVAALQYVGLDLALGSPLHTGVVAAAQSTVGGDHHIGGGLYLLPRSQQGRLGRATGRRQVLDDLGDLIAVGHGGGDPLLGLDDSRCRDEFHGARDLLRGLDATNAPTKNALLTSGHVLLRRQGLVALGFAEFLGRGGGGVDGSGRGRAGHEPFLEGDHHPGELIGYATGADTVEKCPVAGAHLVEQLGLEAADVFHRHIVEVARGCRRRC